MKVNVSLQVSNKIINKVHITSPQHVILFIELSSESSAVCKHIHKPSQEHANILWELFPTSSSTPQHVDLSSVFDPMQQCVASHQKQKKKAVRCKSTTVSMMLVHDVANCVPRRKKRQLFKMKKEL